MLIFSTFFKVLFFAAKLCECDRTNNMESAIAKMKAVLRAIARQQDGKTTTNQYRTRHHLPRQRWSTNGR